MEVKQTHITIEKDKIEQVIQWAEKHGEIVFAGGGMEAVDSMNVFVESLRRSVAKAEKQEPVAVIKFLKRLSQQTPEKPDYWSSCGQCERNANEAEELLESTHPQPKSEPLTDELADALKTVLNWVDDFCETDEHFAESVEAKADAALEKYEAAHNQRN